MLKFFLIKIIVLYQKTLSPDHGLLRVRYENGFCKYYPSCSEYAKQSILKKGAIKGSFKSIFRVIRCNPFTLGGIDNP